MENIRKDKNIIYQPAIIIITYNRPVSFSRVLSSIEKAFYEKKDINLVISIDYQNSKEHDEVVQIANDFYWNYGGKLVIEHKKNLGLRNHVISCGNLSEKYGAIIMLEDDIYVSPQFYDYSVQILNFYQDTDYIGGISLYKHCRNVNINRPFYPEKNTYDVFLMQFAQSWGQCWTYKMWNDFYFWYIENKEDLLPEDDIPQFVSSWPNSSWLKYFIKYIIKTNKYFVYPYESLSTNFGDSGTHNLILNNDFQVPLQLNNKKYEIPDDKQAIIYDAFFERQNIYKYLKLDSKDLCIDLYSSKKNKHKKRYWLTIAIEPYKIIKSYGLNFRPHEMNIIMNNEGNDIFLYDTKYCAKKRNKKNCLLLISYDFPRLPIKNILKYLYYKLLKKYLC